MLSGSAIPSTQVGARELTLLIVGDHDDLPGPLQDLLAGREFKTRYAGTPRQACEPGMLSGADAVLICPPARPHKGSAHEMQLLADALASHRLTGVVLSPGADGVVPGDDDALMQVPAEASADELWGRIAAMQQYRPLLARMEEQVVGMQRLGKKLNEQFVEVDQELRLASRLQRDFLPKQLPSLGDVRFHALYRPATWVCGDVYDVQRLDERTVSFYVADAVGHGVAAGLLTMFIKQAVAGKHILADGYAIVPPSEVLERLNGQLADQHLPNCQFITACYGIIDAQTGEICLARGGHPYPVHVGADGTCLEVQTPGGLLGIFHGETYPDTTVVLRPGEKLILYSDGLEDLVLSRAQRGKGPTPFGEAFQRMVRQPGAELIHSIAAHLDNAEGSLQPADDMTLVVVERL